MAHDRLGTVAIIGVGLIGGSIGLALRKRTLAAHVVGIGRDATRLSVAERLGAVDEFTTNLAQGVAEADVIVVCTPVNRVVRDTSSAARHAPATALITDVGSTKREIVEQIEADERSCRRFVGAHPLAGSERRGADHASSDLFEDRVCILTPTEKSIPSQVERARDFWSSLGCRILELDPKSHDEALARTSHLPHALAAALAAIVPEELLPLAAGAYRDCTRVAQSDSGLWSGIFLANRRPVLDALDALRGQLTAFELALRGEDEVALRAWWDNAKQQRLAFNRSNVPSA